MTVLPEPFARPGVNVRRDVTVELGDTEDMRITDEDVDTFIASSDHADSLRTLDTLIRASLPADTGRVVWRGTLWGGTEQAIIGYGRVTQPRSNGGTVEWFLVGLARQKRSFSLYVNAVDGRQYLGQKYADRLGKVTIGAASIGFTRIENLDLETLRTLLAEAAASTAAPEASVRPARRGTSAGSADTGAGDASELADLLARVKPRKRVRDARTLLDLYARVTGVEPRVWKGIVAYGSYRYRYDSGHAGEAPAAGFAPRSNATALYLSDGVGAHAELLAELGPHEAKVGCVYIKDLELVDLDVLERLVRSSYEALTGVDVWTGRAREGGAAPGNGA